MKLTLRNWMCHQELVLDLVQPVGMVVGDNGVGKTAVRDALEFLFTGFAKLRGVPTKKELAVLAIRDGCTFCEVALETPSMRVRRHMTREGAAQECFTSYRTSGGNWTPEEPMPRDKLANIMHLGGSLTGDEIVRLVLEPRGFFELDAHRRRELLVLVTSSGAESSEVEAALTDALDPQTEQAQAAVAQAVQWVVDLGFRGAEAQAVELRKAAKRRLTEAVVPSRPEPVHDGVDLAAHPLEAHEQRLRELREQLTAAERAASQSLGVLEGELAEARRALAAVQSEEASLPPADAQDLDALATGVRTELGQRQDQIRELEEREAVLVHALDEARKAAAVNDLEIRHPGDCPAVAFRMRCPVKLETFRKAAAKAAPDRKGAEERAQQLEGELSELRASKEEAEGLRVKQLASLARLEARQAAEAERVAAVEAWTRRRDAAQQRIHELAAKLTERRRYPTSEGEVEAGDPEQLAEAIAKGEAVVAAKRAYDQQVAAIERKATERQEIGREVALWDALATALKPDGIESRLAGSAREFFHDLLAEVAGIAGDVQIADDFTLRVLPAWPPDGRIPRHVLQLSTAQQLAVGVAVQHALAQLIEFPVLVTDRLDTFEPAARQEWFAFAQKVAHRYPGGVLGLATKGATAPQPPPQGALTFWLQRDGGVKTLGGAF